jgi:putative transposase
VTGLTKTVLETALEAEITDHSGYDKHDPMGRNGGNSRNGTRPKTSGPIFGCSGGCRGR